MVGLDYCVKYAVQEAQSGLGESMMDAVSAVEPKEAQSSLAKLKITSQQLKGEVYHKSEGKPKITKR